MIKKSWMITLVILKMDRWPSFCFHNLMIKNHPDLEFCLILLGMIQVSRFWVLQPSWSWIPRGETSGQSSLAEISSELFCMDQIRRLLRLHFCDHQIIHSMVTMSATAPDDSATTSCSRSQLVPLVRAQGAPRQCGLRWSCHGLPCTARFLLKKLTLPALIRHYL